MNWHCLQRRTLPAGPFLWHAMQRTCGTAGGGGEVCETDVWGAVSSKNRAGRRRD